jgi:hypothetical protein
MSKIDKYNAPRNCIAVVPEELSHDGIGGCSGCCFDSGDDGGCMLDMQHDYASSPCWAEGREDRQDVIFKREESSSEGDAVALDFMKKSLDNLPAAWKVFQQHKEAAKALHHH